LRSSETSLWFQLPYGNCSLSGMGQLRTLNRYRGTFTATLLGTPRSSSSISTQSGEVDQWPLGRRCNRANDHQVLSMGSPLLLLLWDQAWWVGRVEEGRLVEWV
jgi:hypothetical protein